MAEHGADRSDRDQAEPQPPRQRPRSAYLLPCLGRTEEDMQASGPQAVTVEDTFSSIHGSIASASPRARSCVGSRDRRRHREGDLAANPKVRWDELVADYATDPRCDRQDLSEGVLTISMRGCGRRAASIAAIRRASGHGRRRAARLNSQCRRRLERDGFDEKPGRYRLITMRSNDQFNTTIYGFSDRLRGIEGGRDVLLINPRDMERAALEEGQVVTLVGDADDGVVRQVGGLKVTPFDLPDGCLGAYYPEANPLVPLWAHDQHSKTPASKSVPVCIVA